VPPSHERLFHTITQFVNSAAKPVVLLDGLEYIVTHTEFSKTIKFVDAIKDLITVKQGILILPLSAKAYSKKELSLLKANTLPLDEITIAQADRFFKETRVVIKSELEE
jgi:archaellum biogenesis ATPase FlaH